MNVKWEKIQVQGWYFKLKKKMIICLQICLLIFLTWHIVSLNFAISDVNIQKKCARHTLRAKIWKIIHCMFCETKTSGKMSHRPKMEILIEFTISFEFIGGSNGTKFVICIIYFAPSSKMSGRREQNKRLEIFPFRIFRSKNMQKRNIFFKCLSDLVDFNHICERRSMIFALQYCVYSF